ncbi:hypothetical protein V5O48_010079 [Marasmius crinis-equi]|uniref:Uncharacterized protein n=1 Tax=Marasmius crinis-equi TaxID=585013 RepID=A0ABR3F9G5_9AGAR
MPPDRRTVSFGKALKSPIKKQGKSDKQRVSLDIQKHRRRDLESRIAQLRQPSRPTPSTPAPSSAHQVSAVGSSALPVEYSNGVVDESGVPSNTDAYFRSMPPTHSMPLTPTLSTNNGDNADILSDLPGYDDGNSIPEPSASTPPKSAQATPKATPKRRRKEKKRPERAEGTTEERPDLIDRWKEVLKTLEEPLLLYKERTLGAAVGQGDAPLHQCKHQEKPPPAPDDLG